MSMRKKDSIRKKPSFSSSKYLVRESSVVSMVDNSPSEDFGEEANLERKQSKPPMVPLKRISLTSSFTKATLKKKSKAGDDAFITGLTGGGAGSLDALWNRNSSPVPDMTSRVPTPSTTRSHLYENIHRSVLPAQPSLSRQLTSTKKSKISSLTSAVNNEKLEKYLPAIERGPALEDSVLNRRPSSIFSPSHADRILAKYSHKLPKLREACNNLTGTLRELNNVMASQSNSGKDAQNFQKQLDALQSDANDDNHMSKVDLVHARMKKVKGDELVPYFTANV